MLASGNSDRLVCAGNLVKTIRGECPMERTKGIAREIIDAPVTQENKVKSDVEWTVTTYEPRITNLEISLGPRDAEHGDVGVLLKVT